MDPKKKLIFLLLPILLVGCNSLENKRELTNNNRNFIDKRISTSTNKKSEELNREAQSKENTKHSKSTTIKKQLKDKKRKNNNEPITDNKKKNDNRNIKQERYKVLKVIDGDTIVINYNQNRTTLRLVGIDSPETKHPNKPVECFGNEASKKMKQLVLNKKVKIKQDKINSNRDKYNRLLRYVYVDDTFVNAEMIKQGYAYAYLTFPFEYSSKFRKLQQSARKRRLGLWEDNACKEETVDFSQHSEKKNLSSTIGKDSKYKCSYNRYDCSDFSTRQDSQKVFEICGGKENDIHHLDRGGDGQACESLP